MLTRPREQAYELIESLQRLGANSLVMPTIRIVPLADLRALDEAIGRLATYDWLVFTSVNAVAIFGKQWQAAGRAVNPLRQNENSHGMPGHGSGHPTAWGGAYLCT